MPMSNVVKSYSNGQLILYSKKIRKNNEGCFYNKENKMYSSSGFSETAWLG